MKMLVQIRTQRDKVHPRFFRIFEVLFLWSVEVKFPAGSVLQEKVSLLEGCPLFRGVLIRKLPKVNQSTNDFFLYSFFFLFSPGSSFLRSPSDASYIPMSPPNPSNLIDPHLLGIWSSSSSSDEDGYVNHETFFTFEEAADTMSREN